MALLDMDWIKRLLSGDPEALGQTTGEIPVPEQRPIEAAVLGPQQKLSDMLPAQEPQANAYKATGLLGMLPQSMQPESAESQQALARALIMGGASAMANPGDNALSALGQILGNGMQTYDSTKAGLLTQQQAKAKQQQEEEALQLRQGLAQTVLETGQQQSTSRAKLAELAARAVLIGDDATYRQIQAQMQELDKQAASKGMIWDDETKAYAPAPGYQESNDAMAESEAAAKQRGTESEIRTDEQRKYDEDKAALEAADPNAVIPAKPIYEINKARELDAAKSTDDIREYNLYVSQEKAAGRVPKDYTTWTRDNKTASRTQINVNTGDKAENAFGIEAGKKQAEQFIKLAEEFPNAQQDLANISQLRTSLKDNPGGFMQGIKSWASSYGVKLGDDASELEYANSLINKLTPAQRVPGSGASSDLDVRMFKESLPQIMNTPGGNEMVLDQMEALARYKEQVAIIAQDAINGDITRQDATKQIRELGDPLSLFKEWKKSNKLADPSKVKDVPALKLDSAGVVDISTVEEWNALAPGTRVRFKGSKDVKIKP